jgi:hypothetical protein
MSFRFSLCILSLLLALAEEGRRAVEVGERKGTSGQLRKYTIHVHSFPYPSVAEMLIP